MKYNNILLPFLAMGAIITACQDDDYSEPAMAGAPSINVKSDLSSAFFGDSLRFTVNASDASVALSTLKAQLYFGEEVVGQTTIRTKVSGADYSGSIYVPFVANIPNGTATLEFTLENVTGKMETQEIDVKVSRPAFEYVSFISEDGKEYKLLPGEENYVYTLTDNFAQKMNGYIVTPKYGANGNELRFGYQGGSITLGADNTIPFANSNAGLYTISFNTLTFEGAPFIILSVNGTDFVAEDNTHQVADLKFTQGEKVNFDGFGDLDDWYIDPDFFVKGEDGTLTFNSLTGDYRVIADQKLNYFRVYALKGGNAATLQDDGSGALWIIGEGIGKPSVSANAVGWTTENALCMAQISEKVYQITVLGGTTVNTSSINFKFFGQMGWGVELTGDKLTSTSDIILVGDGNNGHDNGNLFLADGAQLEANSIYTITVDLTAGISAGVMSVKKVGEVEFEAEKTAINGTEFQTIDNTLFAVTTTLNQGDNLQFTGFDNIATYWADPDFFAVDNGSFKFIPVSGEYNVVVNKGNMTITAARYNDGAPATLDETTGSGAIYMLGWGAGSPSLDSQFGWETNNAFALAEVSPAVYQFTCVAGPEKESVIGQRIRYDYISIKFFYQKGWGGEFGDSNLLTLAEGSDALLKVVGGGNIEFSNNLEENATYVITVDLSAGVTNGVLSITKK